MLPFSRRETLIYAGSALAAAALSGCAPRRPVYVDKPAKGPVIDAHCHLFNGTDLPITTFLTRLALPGYGDQTCDLGPRGFRVRSIEDPTLIEELVRLLIDWLLAATPTAREELDRLTRNHTSPAADETARVRGRTIRNLTRFLDDSAPKTAGVRALERGRLRNALRQEIQTARREKDAQPLTTRQEAEAIVDSPGNFGGIIRWVWLFFRSRQSLAQELCDASRNWERDPVMLVPMMVDYAHWLGETTQYDSSFFDQIAVYGALCTRSPVPIHGMVPFDPLRSVFWTRGKHHRFPDTPEFDPLDLAEKALNSHGFLGLKFYPPMGFRATGNAGSGQDYPPKALLALDLKDDALGRELDAAMRRAFDFCIDHDAPMLAHANNSVAAGKGYGRRAEPRFWIDALTSRPNLRLCLAHGGGFCWASTDPAEKGLSWEWTIGRYVAAHPDSHLYMDISYFSDIFDSPGKADRVARQLQDWIRECDREVRHIIFGTDWIMLDKEEGFPTYGTRVAAFLQDRCGLTDAQLDRVLWQNAMRFLGLDSGKTRERLLGFYGSRRPVWTTLEVS
jgi:predicted TIM-barrel fold metal-dependent hydrolase